VPSRVAMTLFTRSDQAARAKLSVALLWFAPFNESEQLGSHTRLPVPTSKPISPVCSRSVYLPPGSTRRGKLARPPVPAHVDQVAAGPGHP
jgi:hypothetical protein